MIIMMGDVQSKTWYRCMKDGYYIARRLSSNTYVLYFHYFTISGRCSESTFIVQYIPTYVQSFYSYHV